MDISPLSSRLCSQPTDDKSSADEDNHASVRGAFSNWGRGEAAARGGEGAYIKQPNSERASTLSGKRNVRGREKSMGNFGTDRYILGVSQDPAASYDIFHATLTLQLQVKTNLHTCTPPPNENTRRLSGPDPTAPAEAGDRQPPEA